MAMKRPLMTLFSKFTIGISLTVLIFGALNIIIVRNSVTESLEAEFERRGYFIARTLAEQSVSFILSDNQAGLNQLVNEIKAIDETIEYVFILNERGEVLAHTFNFNVPASLMRVNIPGPDQSISTVFIRDAHERGHLVKDFAMPVLSRDVGIVRVGILENEIRRQVASTLEKLWAMVALFLLLGVLGALFFSYTIATPLKTLSEQSQAIDIRNIQTGLERIRESTKNIYYRIRRIFNRDDEIDILYENYTLMLQRLEETHHKMNQLQQSLMQSEKMASIGTLTAGIAHEINNPLAGISIGLKRISKKPENVDQIREYCGMMEEALGRIEQVIKDLLAFSRKSHLQFETINACDTIRKTVKLAQYRVKSDNISINIDDKACPCELFVAPNRIEQVFLNIIINAIDSISERMKREPGLKGEIRVWLQQLPDEVQIIFADNGCGIEPQVIKQIFDPFFTTKKVGEGTGLGLSVSYQIMQDHGGGISVESEPGKGSKFFVILPKRQS
jgi:two-component system, NtrC family, sensor kinase